MCAVNPDDNSDAYKLLSDTARNRKLPRADGTKKSLCWASYDAAPKEVKDVDYVQGELAEQFTNCGGTLVTKDYCESVKKEDCMWKDDLNGCVPKAFNIGLETGVQLGVDLLFGGK